MTAADLYATLRQPGFLWHSTPALNAIDIIRSGEITPNRGQFAETFPQSRVSWSRRLGGVSLFDCDGVSDEEFEVHHTDYKILASVPGRVLIKIERKALEPTNLITPRQFHASPPDPRLGGVPVGRHMRVPYLEAVHLGPVPARAFVGFCLTAYDDDRNFLSREFEPGPELSETMQAVIGSWTDEFTRRKAERHARGEIRLEEVLADVAAERHGRSRS
jgi:hypothetical protein